MHELRAVEIGLVVGRGNLQQHRHERDRDQNGVGERMMAHGPRERVGDQIRAERRCQPEQRRRLQIDPEAERVPAASLRLTRRKTPTVASSVAIVETTTEAASATQCSLKSPRYCTTPTPAGTNNSDSEPSSPVAARPTSLLAISSSLIGRRRVHAANPSVSNASPITGPGAGSPRPRARTSPTSWHASRRKKPRIMGELRRWAEKGQMQQSSLRGEATKHRGP